MIDGRWYDRQDPLRRIMFRRRAGSAEEWIALAIFVAAIVAALCVPD